MSLPYFVDFDPIALPLGPVGVHWYGLMYLGGFVVGWLLGEYRRKRGYLPVTRDAFADLAFYCMLGVIIGGRIWYMLFLPVHYSGAHGSGRSRSRCSASGTAACRSMAG